jgi:hypothetical protein
MNPEPKLTGDPKPNQNNKKSKVRCSQTENVHEQKLQVQSSLLKMDDKETIDQTTCRSLKQPEQTVQL